MTSALPLAGTVVVSVEQAVAAPLATRRLADAGARVIKVERPGGDFARGYDRVVEGASAYFVWLNRGKESVVVDLKDAADAAWLRELVAGADVFVQNLAPGAAARAGFGSGALRRAHPRLVTCDISGYGEEGPWAARKAYDNLVQGEAGLQAVTGTPDAPSRIGISVCDIAAGMHAWGAIVEALLHRERTGEGSGVGISLFDAVADWMAVPYLHQVYGGRAPARTGLQHPSIAPYGPFRSAEGDVVLVAVQNEREWVRLCAEVLLDPDLAADLRFQNNPARVENRAALRARIQETFSAFDTATLLARLETAGVAFGRMNDVAGLASHPQLRLVDVATPAGAVRLPADPVRRAPAASEDPRPPGDGARGSPPSRLDRPTPPRVPALDEQGRSLRNAHPTPPVAREGDAS